MITIIAAIATLGCPVCLVIGYYAGYKEGWDRGYKTRKNIYEMESEHEWDFRKARMN